jgi:hypothetical protein
MLTGSTRHRELQRIHRILQPTIPVDTIAYQLQRANRRGNVRRVSGNRRITECRCRQERSRGRIGKRVGLVNVVQQRAVRLLKKVFRQIRRQRYGNNTTTTPRTWNFHTPSNVSRTQHTRSFCCNFIDSAADDP